MRHRCVWWALIVGLGCWAIGVAAETGGPSRDAPALTEGAPSTSTELPEVAGTTSDRQPSPTSAPSPAWGPENGMPAHLLQLPADTDAALVADLTQNRLFLYRQDEGPPRLTADYYVAIGKQGPHKRVEGDERTPVGVYFVTRHITDAQLPELYGVGAFPVNYPNLWDRRLQRTGSGIWIHGMPRDQAVRPARSSRGCLAMKNDDFDRITDAVQTRDTPVLIAENITWVSPEANEARRAAVADAVESWRQAWESLDTDRYLAFYAREFRFGRMDLEMWTRHKRRVNAHKRFIRIGLDEVGIYGYPDEHDLVLVDFRQRYRSNNFSGTSRKRQYWRRQTDGSWRIVHEGTATP